MDLSDLRRDFGKDSKREIIWPENPFLLFKRWLQEAIDANISEANAMVLSTAASNGKPSSRIVLLKEFSEADGLIFYTNYSSRKGKELTENPFASVHFFWREKERQLLIEGKIKKVSDEKSAAYFSSRPRVSQASAAVSPQSEAIDSLEVIRKAQSELLANPEAIQCPKNWGGYCLVPHSFSFWQGGKSRLHQRAAYSHEDSKWIKRQLAP